jgi:uncharacterized protein YndB with AHSA1/START domain
MSTQTFTLTRSIQVSPPAVYRAFTTATGLLDWLAHSSDVEARVGGRLYGWDQKAGGFLGQFTALEKDQRVAFDLFAPVFGHVDVTLVIQDPTTCLTFTYQGDAPETVHPWWQNALDALQAVLETGLDPRLYNRPMLGILISGMVDKEAQERLHLPLDYGILIGGTLPGMGAEKVGFQDGDVLVELSGTPIHDYHSIGAVIGTRNAGDTVHVVWYRGKARHAADMILSGRPHPRIPATLAELAEEARQIYASLDVELAEILDEVPESAAEYRPAENEWNVKEIIAHLINTERAMQIWLVNAVEGTLFQNWVSNNHHIVKSIVDVTPTLPELLTELRRAEAQTVALLQRLPEEIVTHKGAFHNLVTTLNKEGLSVHTRLHFETIKRLVEEVMK